MTLKLNSLFVPYIYKWRNAVYLRILKNSANPEERKSFFWEVSSRIDAKWGKVILSEKKIDFLIFFHIFGKNGKILFPLRCGEEQRGQVKYHKRRSALRRLFHVER